jgi:hypothetical protein
LLLLVERSVFYLSFLLQLLLYMLLLYMLLLYMLLLRAEVIRPPLLLSLLLGSWTVRVLLGGLLNQLRNLVLRAHPQLLLQHMLKLVELMSLLQFLTVTNVESIIMLKGMSWDVLVRALADCRVDRHGVKKLCLGQRMINRHPRLLSEEQGLVVIHHVPRLDWIWRGRLHDCV